MNEVAMYRKLIEDHGLNTTSRKRELVYKRYFLYARMRRRMSLVYIASLFNKDHASVIYGIKTCRYYEKTNDFIFNEMVDDLRIDYERLFNTQHTFTLRVRDYHNGVALINIQMPMEEDQVKELQNVENFSEFSKIMDKNRCASVKCASASQV
jgi:hypothetical protein